MSLLAPADTAARPVASAASQPPTDSACVVSPGALPAEPALRAHLQRMRELRPGLRLHSEDALDALDMTAQTEMAEGVRIVLLLEGELDLSYGHQRIALSSAPGKASAAIVSVAEPERFTRRTRKGTYSRRVSLGLGRDWIAQTLGDLDGTQARALDAFMKGHLASRRWQLSARAAALAEQVVHPPQLEPLLGRIYLESRALELAGEAFAGLSEQARVSAAAAPSLRPREHQRLRELHAFLTSGQADRLSLDEIARHAGVNANTLQQQFRAVHGLTIFEHLRECRMQRARLALEREGVTVGQAAMVAGYTSSANFSTAYRRRFGHSPKLARSRV